jgi:hypothetical protein
MDQFLHDFRQTIETSKDRLLAIPEDTASIGRDNQWSAKEIVGHLIDSAANNHQRFVRAQASDDLVCSGYDQDQWVDVQKYSQEKWADLVHLWAAYNLHLLHFISVMPQETLTCTREKHNLDQVAFKAVDQTTPTTLEYFIRDYAGHLQHHLNQIFERTRPDR